MKNPLITLKAGENTILRIDLWTLINLRIYEGAFCFVGDKKLKLYLDREEVEKPIEMEE